MDGYSLRGRSVSAIPHSNMKAWVLEINASVSLSRKYNHLLDTADAIASKGPHPCGFSRHLLSKFVQSSAVHFFRLLKCRTYRLH